MNNSEQQAIEQAYRTAWEAFAGGGSVEPAFGIRSDDSLHLVFLLPIGVLPGIAERVAPIQERLAFPYADLVPAEKLHVTIQGFDVGRSTWAERSEELLVAAGSVFAQILPFTLRLGWPNSFAMAAFLRADDGGVIRLIRANLRGALPAWAGLDRDPLVRGGQDEWLPHMSLAYYNRRHDNQALVEAIAPLRDEVVADTVVREVHLIATPADLTGTERWVWPVQGIFALGSRDQE